MLTQRILGLVRFVFCGTYKLFYYRGLALMTILEKKENNISSFGSIIVKDFSLIPVTFIVWTRNWSYRICLVFNSVQLVKRKRVRCWSSTYYTLRSWYPSFIDYKPDYRVCKTWFLYKGNKVKVSDRNIVSWTQLTLKITRFTVSAHWTSRLDFSVYCEPCFFQSKEVRTYEQCLKS